jgi:hypothetical protein
VAVRARWSHDRDRECDEQAKGGHICPAPVPRTAIDGPLSSRTLGLPRRSVRDMNAQASGHFRWLADRDQRVEGELPTAFQDRRRPPARPGARTESATGPHNSRNAGDLPHAWPAGCERDRRTLLVVYPAVPHCPASQSCHPSTSAKPDGKGSVTGAHADLTLNASPGPRAAGTRGPGSARAASG